jgi:hypothetical protein
MDFESNESGGQYFAYTRSGGVLVLARLPELKPSLKLSRHNENLLLSWPASVEGYTLEHAGDLGATEWELVDRPPVTIGNERVVTVPQDSGARFYRLRQP